MLLHEAARAGDDHRADGVRAHDVRVVVDLDAARTSVMPKAWPSETRSFCCEAVSARRRPSASLALRRPYSMSWRRSPRCGDMDLDPRLGARRERRGHQFDVLDLVREQDQPRRRLVVVELRHEGATRPPPATSTCRRLREIGAVAPVLPVAEEEHLDAELARLLVEGEDVRILDGLRVDALHALDRRRAPRAGRGSARRARTRDFPAASCISALMRSFTACDLPDRKARASAASSPYSSAETSPVQGPEQRLIWKSRHGRVRF